MTFQPSFFWRFSQYSLGVSFMPVTGNCCINKIKRPFPQQERWFGRIYVWVLLQESDQLLFFPLILQKFKGCKILNLIYASRHDDFSKIHFEVVSKCTYFVSKFRNVLSIVTFWQQTKYTKCMFRLNKEVEKCHLSSINTRLQFWNDIWFTLPIQLF